MEISRVSLRPKKYPVSGLQLHPTLLDRLEFCCAGFKRIARFVRTLFVYGKFGLVPITAYTCTVHISLVGQKKKKKKKDYQFFLVNV